MGYFYDTFMLICAIFQAFTSPIHCNCMQKGSTSKLFKMSPFVFHGRKVKWSMEKLKGE